MTKRASGVSSGILVHQAAESSYCVETKEYMGVIDLYGGGDWERFSMLPSDPHAPSSTSTWSGFDARLVTILLIPCIKLVDRVKNSLTDFDEGWSPPPGPERLQVPEAPLRYSAGVQLRYRRKTLFR